MSLNQAKIQLFIMHALAKDPKLDKDQITGLVMFAYNLFYDDALKLVCLGLENIHQTGT